MIKYLSVYMLPESPLDRIYDHWLRIGVDGYVLDCSQLLRSRVAKGEGDSEFGRASDCFDLQGGDENRFYFAWTASLKGRAGTLRLNLAGSESQRSHVSLMPQFSEEGSVVSVVAGIVEEPALGLDWRSRANFERDVFPPDEMASGRSHRESELPKLLVVDDNPNNLLIASKLSRYLGYEAETASNGIDALDLMQDGSYDIVLMDLRMAPLNGIETARRIRDGQAGNRSSDTYIIAVTAHALGGDKERCLASGMNDYLTKPLTLDRLRDSLDRACSELSLD